jgi:predicted SnoaL-like aldol condensation-catalyzing enzyme
MKTQHLLASVLLAVAGLANAAQPATPTAVFEQYVQAVHAADMAAVRALIASDVERSDFVGCTPQMDNPACLAFYIEQTVVKPRAQLKVISVQLRGDELHARLEVRSELYRKTAGVERIVGTDVLRITDGKIHAFRFIPDFNDEATASFFASIGIKPPAGSKQP